MMFEDFAAASRQTDCLVVPMDRYITSSLADVSIPDFSRVDDARVAFASPEHGPAVTQIITAYWPALARYAFDIVDERLMTDCMHSTYRELGLRRDRTVFVLSVDEQIVGAALCEWTDSEISLFNVLNMAHVFLARHREISQSACDLLAQAVRSFYAERGAPPPLIACPPGTFKDVPPTGCTWTETMGCIVWNAEGLRRFEQYVAQVLADQEER
jgi:hypothetical protein